MLLQFQVLGTKVSFEYRYQMFGFRDSLKLCVISMRAYIQFFKRFLSNNSTESLICQEVTAEILRVGLYVAGLAYATYTNCSRLGARKMLLAVVVQQHNVPVFRGWCISTRSRVHWHKILKCKCTKRSSSAHLTSVMSLSGACQG